MSTPSVILSSGQSLKIEEIRLFDHAGLQEVSALRAKAAKALGPGAAIGVMGAPSLTLAAEAVAVSVVSGMLAGTLQKQATEWISRAQLKFEEVTREGMLVSVDYVYAIEYPDPHNWRATVGGKIFAHNGTDFITVKSNIGEMRFRWSQVVAYLP